jgi:hypothetical protein
MDISKKTKIIHGTDVQIWYSLTVSHFEGYLTVISPLRHKDTIWLNQLFSQFDIQIQGSFRDVSHVTNGHL